MVSLMLFGSSNLKRSDETVMLAVGASTSRDLRNRGPLDQNRPMLDTCCY